MGYVLQGVLGSSAVLAPCHAVRHARVVSLSQKVYLLLMTDAFFDEVRQERTDTSLPGFWKLPNGFDRLLAAWSARGPVAYVEAEYFGGHGTQAAAVWHRGDLVLGPLVEYDARASGSSPISQALARLGVSARGYVDEFEAAGLSRHRDMDNWLSEAL